MERERQEEQNLRGVRKSKFGKWVAETQCPNKGTTIWLGSYSTQLAAELAYDTAVYHLHGPTACLNFPDLVFGQSSLTDLSVKSIINKAFEVGQSVDALEPGEGSEPGCKGSGSCCGGVDEIPENPKVKGMEKGSISKMKREREKKLQLRRAKMRKKGKWAAEIRNKRTIVQLGAYSTPFAAARAYDTAAYNLHGSSARLNFPDLVLGQSRLTDLSIESINKKAFEVGKRVEASEPEAAGYGSGRNVVDEKPHDSKPLLG